MAVWLFNAPLNSGNTCRKDSNKLLDAVHRLTETRTTFWALSSSKYTGTKAILFPARPKKAIIRIISWPCNKNTLLQLNTCFWMKTWPKFKLTVS